LAIVQAIGLLTAPTPGNHKKELKKMAEHCTKWDKIYGYDAIKLFPELADVFVENGY